MDNSINWHTHNVVSEAIRVREKTNCPNCGAPIDSEKCEYCGTVFLDFAAMDADKPFFMKIKSEDKVFIVKVRLTDASMHMDTSTLYFDNNPYCTMSAQTELTMNFVVLP